MRIMSKATYHLLGMTIMLVTFWIAARLLLPLVREPSLGSTGWHVPLLGGVLITSPVTGLLLFELMSGRALGRGFSVIRKAESPREYWGEIAFHSSFFLIAAVATWAYFRSSQ